MAVLWSGRFQKELDRQVNDFNSSISFDGRMFAQDIQGSMAHAAMLSACGIISQADADTMIQGLTSILEDLQSGALQLDMDCEDIHTFVEGELTNRIGEVGKRLHTARSRNDQVALDLRLFLRDEVDGIRGQLKELIQVLLTRASENVHTILPGYTHLQRAQPISFAHHLMAYVQMFLRDLDRLADCRRRMNLSPLGSCALAGTTYPTDREMTARSLGFDGPTVNSIDGVSDRDFAVELAAGLSTVMMHLSRFSEEIILWCSWEFKFVELDDAYSTGSSIMPQKKNPDIAELVRGKTGRVYGSLVTLLTMLKGLPLAYNKDMQEDKEAIFDCVDTVRQCLLVFTPMLRTMKILPDNMRAAAAKGFINATDCADYLTQKGLPFRTAYKTVGELVAHCVRESLTLETLPLEAYRSYSDLFEEDIYQEICLEACMEKRLSQGGAAPASVLCQIQLSHEALERM